MEIVQRRRAFGTTAGLTEAMRLRPGRAAAPPAPAAPGPVAFDSGNAGREIGYNRQIWPQTPGRAGQHIHGKRHAGGRTRPRWGACIRTNGEKYR
jgi:hypothetical protein